MTTDPTPCPVCAGTGLLRSPGRFGQSVPCWVCAPWRSDAVPLDQEKRQRGEPQLPGMPA